MGKWYPTTERYPPSLTHPSPSPYILRLIQGLVMLSTGDSLKKRNAKTGIDSIVLYLYLYLSFIRFKSRKFQTFSRSEKEQSKGIRESGN